MAGSKDNNGKVVPGKVSRGFQKGSKHINAKLNENQVRRIRQLNRDEGLGAKKLCKIYGVTYSAIDQLLLPKNHPRRTWRHVEDANEIAKPLTREDS